MRKVMLIVVFALMLVSMVGFVSASCDLDVKMINQDPYPATPGEYVKVVFQVNGTESTECNKVFFDILPEYPFSVEDSETRMVIPGGTYVTGYESFLLKAYRLRVDENALDGENKIKINYGFVSGGSTNSYTKEFDVNIEEARADFEVTIQNYDAVKGTITFGIINVGKYDVESLTLEVSNQENLKLKGSSVSIIGGLDSNDDTTANIEGIPREGNVKIVLAYNDQNDVRRSVEKDVYFSEAFIEKAMNNKTARGIYFYLFWGLVIIIAIYLIYSRRQRNKTKDNKINNLLKR